MILSGEEIKKHIRTNAIIIEPYNEDCVNPNSYNLKLNNKLLVYNELELDAKKDNPTMEIIIPEEGFILMPNILYLGSTVERTKTDFFVPMIEGRSSIGRLGIFIHVTAGFGDIGFNGRWTLEIIATQPVKIYPYMEICQIFYHTIQGKYKKYGEFGKSKYQGSMEVLPSMMHKDYE